MPKDQSRPGEKKRAPYSLHRGLRFLWPLAFVLACGKASYEKETMNPGTQQTRTAQASLAVDQWVTGLGHLSTPEASPKTEQVCGEHCVPDEQTQDAWCEYRRYTETARFFRFVAFGPHSTTLWPGALVRGEDAERGLLTPLAVEPGPIRFSVSLENIKGSPVGFMQRPSLSSFRAERNRILADDVTGATPAALQFEIESVHSSTQLSIALGASVSWPGGNEIAGSFSFASGTQKTRAVVNFTQAYYTIDVDALLRPSDFFDPKVTIQSLEGKMDGPPLYIQAVTYGRRVIFTIEAESTEDSLRAALSAAYQGIVQVKGELSAEHREVLEAASIQAFVYGGSGSDASAVINGYEGLVQFIQKGGDYGKHSPGAPISYRLAYLDNTVAQFAFTTDYVERSCRRNRSVIKATVKQLTHLGGGDLGGDLELYGTITLRRPTVDSEVVGCEEGGTSVELWHRDVNQWVRFDEFTTWTPPDPTTSMSGVPFGTDKSLCITAQLYDNDWEAGELTENDDYGNASLLLPYEDGWAGTHILQVRGQNDRAIDLWINLETTP